MSTSTAGASNDSRVAITSILNPPLSEQCSRMPARTILEPPSSWYAPQPPPHTRYSPGYVSPHEESPCHSPTSPASCWGGGTHPVRPLTADSIAYPRKPGSKRSVYGLESEDGYAAPPTPPPSEDAGTTSSYPYHRTPSASRPCTCSSCKATRYAAHADAHARYSADMAQLMAETGAFAIGGSAASAERFATYFASLAPVEEQQQQQQQQQQPLSATGSFDGGYASGPSSSTKALSSQASAQSKKDAHKIKEKSRRDTVKSFMLSFSGMVPTALGPCTPHRFSKNNVEEPANVTVLDRAALYLTAQRLVLEGLVRDGRLSGDEVEHRLLHVLPAAGALVQKALGRSEAYVGELRWHGIQNPSFEPDTGRGSHHAGSTATTTTGGHGAGKGPHHASGPKRRRCD